MRGRTGVAATEWSIAEVARLSGVTSRTLRHYDAVGLLRPARVGTGGYRHYGPAQMLRLRQVLLLRELGLGLDAIAAVLDGERDRLDTLRRHARRLADEQARLARQARAVADTISELEGGADMPTEQLDGFDPARQARYEEQVAERYGEEVVAESRRRTERWTPADVADVARAYDEVDARLVALIEAGVGAGDRRVLEVLSAHHALVARFWTPDRDSYAELGQSYVDDPDFRARYDARHPALAEFLRDGMAAYAETRL